MAKIFGLNREERQKWITPWTLRVAQVGFDCIRRPPLRTPFDKKSHTPFFIIGSGRSGTTLLRSILQKHSRVNIPPETMGRLPNMIKKYYRYGGLDWVDLVQVCVGEFSSFDTFDYWDIDLEIVRKELAGLEKKHRSLQRIINSLYGQHSAIHKPEADIWADKSPFNTLRLDWLDRVFPDARYVEIIRDGRDVARSYREAALISDLPAAAQRWKQSIQAVEKYRKKDADQVLTVRYENLVTEPESITRKVCAFLDIEYSTEMVQERDTSLRDTEMQHMENVSNPISPKSVGKWKEELTNDEVQMITDEIGELLKKLDYA